MKATVRGGPHAFFEDDSLVAGIHSLNHVNKAFQGMTMNVVHEPV